MTAHESVLAIALAAAALYALGLPLAWLLPAPRESAWVYRIAVAPLFTIAVTSLAALLMTAIGIPLHPMQLLALSAGAWVLAWKRSGAQWQMREAVGASIGPVVIAAFAAVTWFFTLRGYGLYLPNRDFKNHAYIVAQVASSHAADPAELLRASPLAAPNEGRFYPQGLHTVLGWALPTSDFNSLGVTAASAVLTAAISLPLASIALARMLRPHDASLWWIVGLLAGLLPGLTSSFSIGSVVLMAGAALFSAALVTLWLWLRRPTPGHTLGLAIAVVGLLLLHVAEALALGLVGVFATLIAWRAGPIAHMGHRERVVGVLAGLSVVLASLVVFVKLGLAGWLSRPPESWDVEPNDFSVATAPLAAVGAYVGWSVPGVFVLVCVLIGLALIVREGESFPLVALTVPVMLAVVAGAAEVPDWLRVVTAPWYGSIDRVAMLLGAPIALAAGVAVAWGLAPRRLGALRVLVAVGALTVGVVASVDLVAERRSALWATLAGAGDTPRLAVELQARLAPGESVLNFEGDGTANLFAAARVPVHSGLRTPDQVQGGPTGEELIGGLMRLSSPEVAEAMRAAGVAYVAIGTTSMYWGPQPGYSIERLLEQGQLSVELVGTDLTVLRYEPRVP